MDQVAGQTILVVEDDGHLAENIALILKLEGFRVQVVANGQEGLAALQELHPDLILCDILMPNIDGYAFHELVKKNKEIAAVPFIYISALNDNRHLRRGMQAGADDYLCKPFTTEELVASVRTRLERFSRLKEARSAGVTTEQELQALRLLSPRERQILRMVAAGATSRHIAELLHISPKTVELHRAKLMKKLQAPNAAALGRWAEVASFAEINNLIKPSQTEKKER